MTIIQLQYALALARYKSYGRAAEALGISQPGLSLQIKKLESDLDLILFDRSTQPIRLTAEGQALLEQAGEVVDKFYHLRAVAGELRDEVKGSISIGIILTLAPYLVPLFIRDIQLQHPDLQINIIEDTTENILSGLKTGRLHLGIMASPFKSVEKYEVKPLFYEGFQVYVSHQHPLANASHIDVDAIDAGDIWLLREGNCFRNQINNICGLNKGSCGSPMLNYESNSIEALSRIVQNQGGITFLPELSTLHLGEDDLDLLKPIMGQDPKREVSMVYLKNEQRIKYFDLVEETILNNIPKHMKRTPEDQVLHTGVAF